MKNIFLWLGTEPASFYFVALGMLFAFIMLAVLPNDSGAESRREIAFLVVTSLTLFACRWPVLITPYQINPDEASMTAYALKATADIAPWRSFDAGTSGPLNSYVIALPALIGLPITFVSSRIIGLFLMVLVLLALYYAVKWIYGSYVARLSIVPLVLLLSLTTDLNFVHYSSEHFPICIMTIALAASAYLANGEGSRLSRAGAAAIAGFCIGSTPFSKLQAVPIAFVVFVIATAAVFWSWWSKHDRRIAIVFAAMLCVAPAAIFASLWITGELNDAFISYIQAAVGYVSVGFGGVSAESAAVGPAFFFNSSDMYPAFVVGGIIIVSLTSVALIPKRQFTRLSASALAASILLVCAAVYAVYKPHRPYEHYLLFLLVPLSCCVAIALGVAHASGFFRTREPLLAGSYAALFALPMLSITMSSPNQYVQKVLYHLTWQKSEPFGAVARYTKPGDFIAVWGHASEYYVQTRTIMATRDADTPHLFYADPYRDYFRRRYMLDIKRSKPVVFVDAVAPRSFAMTNRASQGHEAFSDLAAYIREEYELKEDVEGIRIYVAKARNSH